MKIAKVMTRSPIHACRAEMRLNEASQLLWDHDCGILPVVDAEERVVGTITDRDICMAAYTTNQRLSELPVERAMAHEVFTCKQTDDVERALKIMQAQQIRRLPVVDEEQKLVGLISINDLARQAGRGRSVSTDRLTETLAAISQPRAAAAEAPETRAPELVTA